MAQAFGRTSEYFKFCFAFPWLDISLLYILALSHPRSEVCYWWILSCITHRSFASLSVVFDFHLTVMKPCTSSPGWLPLLASKLTQDFSPFTYFCHFFFLNLSSVTHRAGLELPSDNSLPPPHPFFVPFFHFLCSCGFVPWADRTDLCKLPLLEESLKILYVTKENFLPLSPWLLFCLQRAAASECWDTWGWVPWMCGTEWEEVLKRDPSHGERIFRARGQEGISLDLKQWLFLWIKLWSYPKRGGGGKKEETTCGFLPPTSTPPQILFQSMWKRMWLKKKQNNNNQTNSPQQNNMKKLSTTPL